MKIIEPSYRILTQISTGGVEELQFMEIIGRKTCKTEDDIILEDGGLSAAQFIKNRLDIGLESVIEHSSLSVFFIIDRGIANELVGHRLASFTQESTRFCNYSEDRFGNELTFIKPFFFEEGSEEYNLWNFAMDICEKTYLRMLSRGILPEEARSVLPNSLKAEIVVTANYREWRNIFKQTTVTSAHPQMTQIMIPLLRELKDRIPVVFDDIWGHIKIKE